MATCIIVLSQELSGVPIQNTFHYNNLSIGAGAPGVPSQLAGDFVAEVLPLINALQSDEVSNVSVYCRDLGAPATAVTLTPGGTGAVVGTVDDTLQPQYVLNIARRGSNWIDLNTGLAYASSRPGRAGRIFLSGLTEEWQTANGVTIPAGLAAAYAALLVELTAQIQTTSPAGNWDHVLFTPAKGALGSLPARNALKADITDVAAVELTRLKRRKT